MTRPGGPWTGDAAGLARRIADFVERSLAGEALPSFGQLAVDIHRWQAAHSTIIGALAEGTVRDWRDIPAVPTALFREVDVGTVPATEARVIFRTSGTTGSKRGAHRLRSTGLYDLGARGWAARCIRDLPLRVVALLEDPVRVPDSSLSHMVATFGPTTWHVIDGAVDVVGLSGVLADAGGPVFVATTALALAAWLDTSPDPLPIGSVLMVTGGFKGRELGVQPDALYDAATGRLQPAQLVTEYGMTELSSQLWGTPGAAYRPPPWLRAVAVDAGGRAVEGVPGQLRFVDLCNLDSAVAIETMDLGRVHADGSVDLLGRIPGAAARGCSLAVRAP